jgi:hypothetical protein
MYLQGDPLRGRNRMGEEARSLKQTATDAIRKGSVDATRAMPFPLARIRSHAFRI